MSEFEDKLHAILSDPEEMERIASLASELMGGAGGAEQSAPAGGESDLLRRLGSVLGGAGEGEKAALIGALSPYLRPERLSRLRRAMRLASAMRMAGGMLREEG